MVNYCLSKRAKKLINWCEKHKKYERKSRNRKFPQRLVNYFVEPCAWIPPIFNKKGEGFLKYCTE